jgi:hypothetical protein
MTDFYTVKLFLNSILPVHVAEIREILQISRSFYEVAVVAAVTDLLNSQ